MVEELEKKIKILEKKLKRSEENRIHSQEMKEKTQILLTRLNEEVNEANIIIQNRNEELKVLTEKAKSAVRIKSDFLANMSHEIRTPMNAIIGFTTLLNKTDVTIKQKDYINKIQNASLNLLHIINDILDFSKIESGKFQLEKIQFNLEEVLNNLVSVINLKAFNKGLELVIMQSPEIPDYLQGDPYRLGQVLLNLTDNAIKFTEKGEVFINVQMENINNNTITLLFEIKDTGIGITSNEKEKLFKSFSQADTSTTRKYGGTGLGLTISKQIVELMEGNIEVHSEVGKGSNFIFTANFTILESAPAKFNNLKKLLGTLKILIIEENPKTREVLKTYIDNFGFFYKDFSSVADAEKAITNSEEFDIIIIGCMLLNVDGLNIIRNIKSFYSRQNNPKYILLTPYVTNSLVLTAKAEGYDKVLMKPVNHSLIYDNILSLYDTTFENSKTYYQESSAHEPDNNFYGINVLLAEDNIINQQVASELLMGEGINVQVVNNGLEAFEALKENKDKFDLVLMDLHMPVMDGYDATQKIKIEIENCNIPIIALTADAMVETREKVLEGGMNDFISKPFEPKELFSIIKKWSKNKTIFHELNTQKALSRLNNNKQLYISILQKFLEYRHISKEFNEINLNNINDKIRIAHTMKGLSGNIGAHKLQFKFLKLQQLLSSPNYATEALNELLLSINETTIIVMEEIKLYLENIEDNEMVHETKPVKSNNFKKDLDELMSLLSSFDIEAKEKFEIIKDELKEKLSKKDMQKIINWINNYDFEEAYLFLKENCR